MRGFVTLLKQSGLNVLPETDYGVSNLYTIRTGVPFVISIVDWDVVEEQTEETLLNIKSNIHRQINDMGFEVCHIHSIYYLDNAQILKPYVQVLQEYWVVDKLERRLYIYENQPDNCLGIRAYLEKYLDGSLTTSEKKKQPFPIINFTVIVINILVYIWLISNGNVYDGGYLLRCGGAYAPYIYEKGEIYRLFTCMFIHSGIMHIANNLFMLAIVGSTLERIAGKVKYLVIYFGGGLLSSLASSTMHYFFEENIVSVGASGAVYAVLGGVIAILLFEKNTGRTVNIRSILLFAILMVYSCTTGEGVDNWAHLSGLIMGFVISIIMVLAKNNKETQY